MASRRVRKRDKCPEPDVLGAFARGSLGAAARRTCLDHLDRCRACSERLCKHGPVEADGSALVVGRYRVLDWVGESSTSVVFRAWDPRARRLVAVKLVPPDETGGRGVQEMLERALRLIRLSDPNVAQVYEAGVDRGQFFVAMELVTGTTLDQWEMQRPRPWTEIVSMYRRVARGLAAAHELGVCHGDFRPGNVLVGDDGRVRVSDFALAAPDEDARGSGTDADRQAFCASLRRALYECRGGALDAGRTSLPKRIAAAVRLGVQGRPARALSMRELAGALDKPARSSRTLLLAPAIAAGILIGLGSAYANSADAEPQPACAGATAHSGALMPSTTAASSQPNTPGCHAFVVGDDDARDTD